MTERRSDGVSGNGGSGGNIGGRFGRDGMRFGLNGKEMEWNMVHDNLLIIYLFSIGIIEAIKLCRGYR